MALNKQRFGWQIRSLLLLFIIGFLSGCTAKTPKVYQVGILSGLDYFHTTTDGFKGKMAELGYVEGKNIVYAIQKTNFDIATYKNILSKFVANKVDLIFVFPGLPTLMWVKNQAESRKVLSN